MIEALDPSVVLMSTKALAERHTSEELRAMKVGRAEIWLANARDVLAGRLESVRMSHQNIEVTSHNAFEVIDQILDGHPELVET